MAIDTVRNYIIGIILFSIVLTSGVFLLGQFFSYDSNIDATNRLGDFNNSFNKASNVTLAVNNIQESIDSVSVGDPGVGDFLNALYRSAYNGIKAIGSSISFMSSAFADAGKLFGLPSFIIPLLFLIITVVIGFAIWSVVTGRN